MDKYAKAIEYAKANGAADGAGAAGWYVQDTIGGRVSGDPAKAARYLLRGIENGDSAITDGFPFADLSGEWADSLTGPELVVAALGADDETPEYSDWFSDICDAYEIAYSDAVANEIERSARYILAD